MIERTYRLTPRKRNLLIRRFILKDTAKAAAAEAGVNINTANLYFNHIRELIFEYGARAPRFSGEVEMDQSSFGKGTKRRAFDERVAANREAYGDVWHPRPEKKTPVKKAAKPILVFGILRREGPVYTKVIEKADRDTLFPIIHLVVEPGTKIYTDKWKGFDGLEISGYTHKQVNHVKDGAVSKDGAHTGNIDSYWSFSKRLMDRFYGISRRTYILHLKECEFRYNHRDLNELTNLIKKLLHEHEERFKERETKRKNAKKRPIIISFNPTKNRKRLTIVFQPKN